MKMTAKAGATCGTWRGRVPLPSSRRKQPCSERRSLVVESLQACRDMFRWPREHRSHCVPSCRLGRCKARKGNGSFCSGTASVGNHHSETPTAITPGAGMA